MRVSPAITRADSIFQTASIVRCVSVAPTLPITSRSCLQRNLSALTALGAVVLTAMGLVNLSQLTLAFSGYLKELAGQFDRLFLGVRLQNCETAHNLFGLCEGTIGHADLATGSPHPRAQCRRQAPLRRQQPACLHALFNQLAHGGHFLLGWRCIPFSRLVDT